MRRVAVVLYYDEVNNELYLVPTEPSNHSFMPDITLSELEGLHPELREKRGEAVGTENTPAD